MLLLVVRLVLCWCWASYRFGVVVTGGKFGFDNVNVAVFDSVVTCAASAADEPIPLTVLTIVGTTLVIPNSILGCNLRMK